VFAGDWGGASTSLKNVQAADSGLDVFFAFVATDALLASISFSMISTEKTI